MKRKKNLKEYIIRAFFAQFFFKIQIKKICKKKKKKLMLRTDEFNKNV